MKVLPPRYTQKHLKYLQICRIRDGLSYNLLYPDAKG